MKERLRDLVKYLSSSIKALSLYPENHPIFEDSIDKLDEHLQDLLKERNELSFAIIEDELVFEDMPFHDLSSFFYSFIFFLEKRKVERITFIKGIDRRELKDFIKVISQDEHTLKEKGGISKELAKTSVTHVVVGKIDTSSAPLTKKKITPKQVYRFALDLMKRVGKDIEKGEEEIETHEAKEIVEQIIESMMWVRSSLMKLIHLRMHDVYSFVHSVNVSILTIAQGERLGLSEDELNDLGISALFHDLGRILIPKEIIKKKEDLTKEEREVVERHPIDGARLLFRTHGVPELCRIVAFEHHIGYDLSGYPKVRRRKLNLAALMVQISDTYDALTSKRSYRGAENIEEVLSLMVKQGGTLFEPRLVRLFSQMIRELYPLNLR
ncbi:MAG: HD domain-containing protein [bacterium]|nr:HD domain-containing protein [bacterium]